MQIILPLFMFRILLVRIRTYVCVTLGRAAESPLLAIPILHSIRFMYYSLFCVMAHLVEERGHHSRFSLQNMVHICPSDEAIVSGAFYPVFCIYALCAIFYSAGYKNIMLIACV